MGINNIGPEKFCLAPGFIETWINFCSSKFRFPEIVLDSLHTNAWMGKTISGLDPAAVPGGPIVSDELHPPRGEYVRRYIPDLQRVE